MSFKIINMAHRQPLMFWTVKRNYEL